MTKHNQRRKRSKSRPVTNAGAEPADLHLYEYEITWEPLEDTASRQLPSELREAFEQLLTSFIRGQ